MTITNLALVTERMFGNVSCELWENEENDIFMTRSQIGSALEYATGGDAIEGMHRRNKLRLDKYSVTSLKTGADGKVYNTYLYTAKGLYEICRISRQPKANEFMDWVWDLLEGIRKQELIVMQTKLLEQKEQVENYNILTNAQNNLSMLEVAKSLRLGRNKLFKFLREEEILMSAESRKNVPYQIYIDQNYFYTVMGTVINNGKAKDVIITTVTPKGIDFIVKICKKKGLLQATDNLRLNA